MADYLKFFRGEAKDIPAAYHDGYVYYSFDENKLYIDVKINNNVERILINGNSQQEILSDTAENWNAQASLVSGKNIIYIYTNQQDDILKMKIGDGSTLLIELPFIDEEMIQHISDDDIHINSNEKNFWNNKMRCEIDDQTIVFTSL